MAKIFLCSLAFLLFIIVNSIEGHLMTSPCGKALADISLFPGDPGYNESARTWNPAYDKILPAFVALPTTTQEIQKCLTCSIQYGVPFTVKSGGHNILGWSTIDGTDDGAFVISFSKMKAIEKVDETTIKVQAGAKWGEIYAWVQNTNYIIVGGQCPTVGVAGFTLGGGINNFLSRTYGLAIDNTLGFTMVTADGDEVVTADKNTNTDLYWALRGSGGGNIGIVTDFTIQLQPAFPSYLYGYILFEKETSANIAEAFATIGSEMYDSQLSFFPVITTGPSMNVTFANFGPLSSAMKQKIQTLQDLASETGNVTFDSYWKLVEANSAPSVASSAHMIRGCFVKSITPSIAEKVLKNKIPSGCSHTTNHMGGAVSERGLNDTAYFFRESRFEIYTTCYYKSYDEKKVKFKFMHDLYFALEMAGECEGNYVNDPELDLHNWQYKYYGNHYERLLEIQNKWNPVGKGMYHYVQSIGSDYNPPPVYNRFSNHVEL